MPEYPDFTDLFSTLTWLSTTGMLAWMIAWSAFFYSLRHPDPAKPFSPVIKWLSDYAVKLSDVGAQVVVTLVSFLIPALAALALAFVPAGVIAAVQPYYGYAALMLSAYLVQQGYHALRPKLYPVG